MLFRSHHLNEKLLIATVLLHIGAIVFYLLRKRENLIKPMISGDREVDATATAAASSADRSEPDLMQASRDDAGLRWRALLIALICAACVAGLVTWSGKAP